MRKMMVILLAVLLTAGMASAANTTWTRPATSGPGNWNDAANWSAGVPDATSNVSYTGASADLAEIQVTTAQTYGEKIYHSTTSAGAAPLLRIMNGGSLEANPVAEDNDHIIIGVSSGNVGGNILIEAGGLLKPWAKLYCAYGAGVTGIVDVAGTLDFTTDSHGLLVLSNNDTSSGTCNVLDGGVVKVFTFRDTYRGIDQPFKDGSLINIEGSGKIYCEGNELTNELETSNYAAIFLANEAADHIAGNGVLGEVVAYYDPYADQTVIIASPTPAARDLVPDDGVDVPVANPLTLSWTIPDAYDGNDVYVDVWLGTDPNALTAEPNVPADYMSPVTTSPANGLNIESTTIDGSVVDTYYWRVDLYIGVDGDPNFLRIGKVQSFNTVDDLPPTVSIETGHVSTWSDEPVALEATVTDDGVSTMTYGWTADPDGSGDPNLTIAFSPDASAEDPTVTITNTTGSMVPVTLTLTATDSTGSVDASTTVDVYNSACHMALVFVGEPHLYADFNYDCVVDILDFAELAQIWLSANTLPTGPIEN